MKNDLPLPKEPNTNLLQLVVMPAKYALALWSRVMRYTKEGFYHITAIPSNSAPRCWGARIISSAKTTAEPRTMPFSIPSWSRAKSLA